MADQKIIFLFENNLFTINGTTKQPLMEVHDSQYKEIVGSCNGLLLILGNKDEDTECLFLVNPTTKEVKELPETDESKYRYAGSLYGIGYSKITNDYKVVKVCRNEIYEYGASCFVYSLNKNSWKECDFPAKFDHEIFVVSGGVNFNGFAHWVTNPDNIGEGDTSSPRILYFDFEKGKFKSLPIPPKGDEDDSLEYDCRSYQLGVVRDCLALAEGYDEDFDYSEGGGYRIWMMKEYGEENSWISLVIEYNERISSVSRFSVDDELLVRLEVVDDEECCRYIRKIGDKSWVRKPRQVELGLYNFEEKSVKELGVRRLVVDEGEEWLYVENSSFLLTNKNEKEIRKGKRSREEVTTSEETTSTETGSKETTSNETQDSSEVDSSEAKKTVTLVGSKKKGLLQPRSEMREGRIKDC